LTKLHTLRADSADVVLILLILLALDMILNPFQTKMATTSTTSVQAKLDSAVDSMIRKLARSLVPRAAMRLLTESSRSFEELEPLYEVLAHVAECVITQ
jgi:hypothetical protein